MPEFEDISFGELERILKDLEKENEHLKKQLSDQFQMFVRETVKIQKYLPEGYKFDMTWE